MKPSELVLTDFLVELSMCPPSGMWTTELRWVRAYDREEAIERMKTYLTMEGYPVFGVRVKL